VTRKHYILDKNDEGEVIRTHDKRCKPTKVYIFMFLVCFVNIFFVDYNIFELWFIMSVLVFVV